MRLKYEFFFFWSKIRSYLLNDKRKESAAPIQDSCSNSTRLEFVFFFGESNSIDTFSFSILEERKRRRRRSRKKHLNWDFFLFNIYFVVQFVQSRWKCAIGITSFIPHWATSFRFEAYTYRRTESFFYISFLSVLVFCWFCRWFCAIWLWNCFLLRHDTVKTYTNECRK